RHSWGGSIVRRPPRSRWHRSSLRKSLANNPGRVVTTCECPGKTVAVLTVDHAQFANKIRGGLALGPVVVTIASRLAIVTSFPEHFIAPVPAERAFLRLTATTDPRLFLEMTQDEFVFCRAPNGRHAPVGAP